jgi:hypothetical protein
MPPPPVLVLRAVAKTFRAGLPGCAASVAVLAGVDLVVRAGDQVALVGPPASGKSTLLLLAAGLLVPDRGEVWRLPGAELSGTRSPDPGRRLALGVREPAPWCETTRLPDRLAWGRRGAHGGAGLVEIPSGSAVPPWVTRVVALERGHVREVTWSPERLAGRASAR